MSYSIIIPVYNEVQTLSLLLNHLEPLSIENEIIFVDDGSDDGSNQLLEKYKFIKLIKLGKNYGKGAAIKNGIKVSNNKKILLIDSDLEIDPKQIKKLMILDSYAPKHSIIGTRYKNYNFKASFLLEFGNFFFTGLFNLINKTSISDALCCAKAFNKTSLDTNKLESNGFDIDIELLLQLVKHGETLIEIPLQYSRRGITEGKKLRIRDGWLILKRLLKN